MNWLVLLVLLVLAFGGVLLQAVVDWPRNWLGAQPTVLPPLVVYCALQGELWHLGVVAGVSGCLYDSLSSDPLGTSVLSLFATGAILHHARDLVLRDLLYAQFCLGLLSTTMAMLGSLVIVLTLGGRPLLGWGSVWQFLVVALAGGFMTPLVFTLVNWLGRHFAYPPRVSTPFPADREIKRGRY